MADKSQIITRFAPSPTGDPHIGSLRNALYAWLYARQNKGKFLLRIDDTDQTRYQAGSDQAIFEMLEWAGLDFDDTWHQSKRLKNHQKYAEELIEKNKAYRCFCSTERLEQLREEQQENKQAPRYDQNCRKLSSDEADKYVKENKSYVVRFAIPETGETKVNDIVRGEVIFQNKELDDFVVLKSDGYPTYHLASVADDNDFGVTHVIRSEEWFPSLPKHVLICQALDWDLPQFVHLPLILAQDKAKLSKRHGATGVLEFKKLGYLPEALINYVLLLGWHPKKGSEKEIYTREEMINEFKLEDVQKSGAIFDYQKLDWLNAHYIRHMDITQLEMRAKPFLVELIKENKEINVPAAIMLEQDRINKLSDLKENLKFIFQDIDYAAEVLIWKKSDQATALERLKMLLEFLSSYTNDWTEEILEKFIKEKIEKEDLGAGDTLWPLRTALAGQKNSPGPFEIAEVLGKEETINRINIAINKLDNE